MSEDFVQTIGNPDLKSLAEYWNRARQQKPMPAWSQINPREIAGQLPIIWVYDYRRGHDTFVGRLAGNKIEALVGKSFRGAEMSELFAEQELEWIHSICRRVIWGPAIHYGVGTISAPGRSDGIGERLILPLSTDGVLADAVIGATVYPQLGLTKAQLDFYEREYWLPLK